MRPVGGAISGAARLLRQGQRAALVGVELLSSAAPTKAIGRVTVGFSFQEARGELQRVRDPENAARTEFGHPERPLSEDLLDGLVVGRIEAPASPLRLEPTPVSGTNLGTVQGGVLALAANEAGQAAGRAGGQEDWRTRDLAVHELSMRKPGPRQTRSRALHRGPDGAGVRIEVLDPSANDRLGGGRQHPGCGPRPTEARRLFAQRSPSKILTRRKREHSAQRRTPCDASSAMRSGL